MNRNNFAVRSAALAAILCVASTQAMAQSTLSLSRDPILTPYPSSMSFSDSIQKDSWKTILYVSAAVLILGLADSNSTLTILGGAGVVVSLANTGQLGFQSRPFRQGIDLVHTGAISFGFDPITRTGLSHEQTFAHPGAYVAASFKF